MSGVGFFCLLLQRSFLSLRRLRQQNWHLAASRLAQSGKRRAWTPTIPVPSEFAAKTCDRDCPAKSSTPCFELRSSLSFLLPSLQPPIREVSRRNRQEQLCTVTFAFECPSGSPGRRIPLFTESGHRRSDMDELKNPSGRTSACASRRALFALTASEG